MNMNNLPNPFVAGFSPAVRAMFADPKKVAALRDYARPAFSPAHVAAAKRLADERAFGFSPAQIKAARHMTEHRAA
jgi:hypothetical protein